MAPSKLRARTLAELRKTIVVMMSPEWDLALEGASDEELTEAARTLLALQRARLRLGNVKLAEIRDKLKDNENALLVGIEFLQEALEDIERVERVLEAATSVLAAVGRVIEIVV
jgi:GTP-sensing pleiotropic transcriptional regulator CodY